MALIRMAIQALCLGLDQLKVEMLRWCCYRENHTHEVVWSRMMLIAKIIITEFYCPTSCRQNPFPAPGHLCKHNILVFEYMKSKITMVSNISVTDQYTYSANRVKKKVHIFNSVSVSRLGRL